MAKSVVSVFLVFIVALAVAMPISVRAMPMTALGGNMAGMAGDQLCQKYPQPQHSGSTAPDRMPTCLTLACMAAPAISPMPALLPIRIVLGAEHVWPSAARLAGTNPAPDPFPPKPIVLV